jgi:hypothetical protein
MIFPNVPPNTPFNTVGMKAPINIEKYDEQGHLVKSYENVPPGIKSLPTGPQRGTVIETPANMQSGGGLKRLAASVLMSPLNVPLMPKMLIDETKQRIANNVFPSGYESEYLNKTPTQRLYDTVIKNEPEPSSRAVSGPAPSNPSDRYNSLEERKNLLAYAMGQSDNLPAAEYKPTDAKNPDAEYFRSPATEKNLRQELGQHKNPLKYIDRHTGDGAVGYHAGVNTNVLGNYTLTKGKDDQGSYLSYYDEYDFDPFSGKVGNAISSAAQAMAGVRTPELYGRIYYDPKTGRPIQQKQAGGTFPQQGPDGLVFPTTPPDTAQTATPTPPPPPPVREAPRFQDTREWIEREYGPDQFGDTLNLTALDLVSEHRQEILQPHAVRDTIAYHETGPHQRMQPNAVQITNRGGQGVGRGMYMYDQPSTLTAANRVDDIANYMGLETPSFISNLRESNGTSRADTLSREQQDMLFMGDLIEGPAPGRAYGAGQTDIETLWYRGHNRRPDEQTARREFRESMRGLEQDNLRNYMFLEDRPNYFERRQRRRGGPMKKYFRLRK